MRALLIWEEVPETTRFFLIRDMTPEVEAKLILAHNHLVNEDDEDAEVEAALTWVNAAISQEKYRDSFGDALRPVVGSFAGNEIAVETLPTSGPFDKVFWTGFIM